MVLSFGSTVYYSYISIRNIKTNKMEKRITEFGKSYWNNNGAYQEEYDKLYEELVPSRGEADTIHGEMIRAVSRLFYDFCNNGNCNVIEVQEELCDDCGTGYYVDGDIVINDYYQQMIDFLQQHLTNKKPVEKLKEFLIREDLGYYGYTFGDDEMKVYNDLVDAVMYQTLTTENKKRIEKDLVD